MASVSIPVDKLSPVVVTKFSAVKFTEGLDVANAVAIDVFMLNTLPDKVLAVNPTFKLTGIPGIGV